MAHQRAFSFTDDSTSVTRPAHWGSSLLTNQLFLRPLDPAVELIDLRQIQSKRYQKIFYSDRLSLKDAWPVMATALQEMHSWVDALSDQIKKPLKKLFRSDVLFSSVLILSPRGPVRSLSDYGKFLIFEYAIEYASLMASIEGNSEEFAFYTSDEVLRASFVARHFLELLGTESALLFSGMIPRVPMNHPPSSGIVAIPNRGVGEMLNRAYRSLDLFERTLESLGSRYGYTDPLNEFKVKSSGLRRSLQASRESWNRSSSIGLGQNSFSGIPTISTNPSTYNR